ncbi:uncharacterized protein LOC134854437 [Symsagittifera roscoffensis]|uniref:uncharacterized protein LOC134854437 n=1 Tax=Symsagittifera roscoffensis TaxID=84072 RepID=UPI00307C5DB3
MNMVYRSVATNRANVKGKRLRLLQFKLRQRQMTVDEKRRRRQHMLQYWKNSIKWILLCLFLVLLGIYLCVASLVCGHYILTPGSNLISYQQIKTQISRATFSQAFFYKLLFYCRYIGAILMGIGVFDLVLVIVYTFWATNERVKVWNYQKQRHLIVTAYNSN